MLNQLVLVTCNPSRWTRFRFLKASLVRHDLGVPRPSKNRTHDNTSNTLDDPGKSARIWARDGHELREQTMHKIRTNLCNSFIS